MLQPEHAKKKELKKAAKTLTLFIQLFCFLVFPLYIIYNGLEHLYVVKSSVSRQQCLDIMRRNLEQIERYSDRQRYLHLLLKKIFDQAQNAGNPTEQLRCSIDNLKKLYPGDFEFIVWNADGKMIKALSDREGFNYILRKLYAVLARAAQSMQIDPQSNIKELPLVKENLNLIRKYLGKIFLPEHLNRPYLPSQQARPLLTDFGGNFNHVWYQIGKKISFLCFMSDRLLHQHKGLTKIVEVINRQNPGHISGYTLSPEITEPQTPVPPQFRATLVRALAEFENLSEPVFENERLLIMVDVAQPGVRSFSIYEKKPEVWSKEILVYRRFTIICGFLLLFHLLLYFHLNYRTAFVSIRWKLTGLFMLANLAPVTILAFIGHDYLINMRVSLRNELQADLLRQIRDFDMRYTQSTQDIAIQLNQYFSSLDQASATIRFSDNQLADIKDFIQSFSPAEAYLVTDNGDLVLKKQFLERDARQSIGFIARLGEAILKFNNGILLTRNRNDLFSALLSPDSAEFIRDSYRLQGKIASINLGNVTKIGYWYIFGDRRKLQNTHILMIIWDSDRFQEHYIDQYFNKAPGNEQTAEFIIQKSNAGRYWRKEGALPSALQKELSRITDFRDSHSGSIDQNGQTQIFACARGRNLDQMILAYLCPETAIEKKVNQIQTGMLIGAGISLLLTLIIGQALSSQFLVPIYRLGEGTLAIGARQFSHRIAITDEDEFGHLSGVFNRVIEGLGELEVARIVQENLFPGNRFQAGPFAIFGKSVVMTTLGGDYYDCFAIDDNNWGVVIGDVAGHGVSAGLMMAMAKAGVIMASDAEKRDPSALVMRLHKIFFAIKNEKLKRMMTLQYFVFNLKTGQFSFANAGHCFPVLVKPAEKKADYLEHVATPLGIGKKPKYANYDFVIAPGESLVLYSDGMAEANNSEGEAFGYNRLKDLLQTVWNNDPEVYYQRIFAAYQDWASSADDDLTLIIINRKNDKI